MPLFTAAPCSRLPTWHASSSVNSPCRRSDVSLPYGLAFWMVTLIGFSRGRGQRQRQKEGTALALLAFDPEVAAVAPGDLVADMQAQAQPAVMGHGRVAGAVEPFEDARDLVGGDADAV